jgi:hypothetical protein
VLQQKFNASGPEAPGDAGDARLRLVGEEVDAVLATAGVATGDGKTGHSTTLDGRAMVTGVRGAPGGLAVLAALVLLVGLLAWRAWVSVEAARPRPPGISAPAAEDLSVLGRFDPFFRSTTAAGDALPVTSLPLALKGIRLDTASGRGNAILAGADGVQVLMGPGEEAMPGVSIRSLAVDHIVLDNAGTLEALWLDEAAGTAQPLAQPGPTAGAVPGGGGQGASPEGGDASGDDADPMADPAPGGNEED